MKTCCKIIGLELLSCQYIHQAEQFTASLMHSRYEIRLKYIKVHLLAYVCIYCILHIYLNTCIYYIKSNL
jgi:hypothetical protein